MTNLDVMELLACCPSDYEICADISQDAAINCIVVDDRNGTIYLTDDKEIALIDAQDNDGDDKDQFIYSLEPYSGVKMIVQPAGIQVKHDNSSNPVATPTVDQSAESSGAAMTVDNSKTVNNDKLEGNDKSGNDKSANAVDNNNIIKIDIDYIRGVVSNAMYAIRRFAAYRSA
jgi:hypothetical protein